MIFKKWKFQSEIWILNVCSLNLNFKTKVRKFELRLTSLLQTYCSFIDSCQYDRPWIYMCVWVSIPHAYCQWWANHKSNYSPKSQIIWQKDLNHYAKSQIKSHEMKSNPNHWTQVKSNHDVNQMKEQLQTLIYARNIVNVHLPLLSMSRQRLGVVLLPKPTV